MMPWDVDAETLGAKTVRFKCQILHSKLVDLIVAPQHILIRIMTGGNISRHLKMRNTRIIMEMGRKP